MYSQHPGSRNILLKRVVQVSTSVHKKGIEKSEVEEPEVTVHTRKYKHPQKLVYINKYAVLSTRYREKHA